MKLEEIGGGTEKTVGNRRLVLEPTDVIQVRTGSGHWDSAKVKVSDLVVCQDNDKEVYELDVPTSFNYGLWLIKRGPLP